MGCAARGLAVLVSDTKIDPNLARVIEAARVRAGLSKFKLAVRSGLSLGTVRLACSGLATTRTLAKLGAVLGVTVDEMRQRASQAVAP